ncbi:diacylglycerol O-acyltransferase 1 [Madurella fahalii]|uniref:diacylglycerol O-acyltransferase n=1 Tax=Madurella fahalii TaxID=1157608 RepID=A0ABQ0G0L0_9PEZI
MEQARGATLDDNPLYSSKSKKKRGAKKTQNRKAAQTAPHTHSRDQSIDASTASRHSGSAMSVADSEMSSVSSFGAKSDSSGQQSLDGHLTSPSEAHSVESKSLQIGQRADMAESTGDVAEKEAEHLLVKVEVKNETGDAEATKSATHAQVSEKGQQRNEGPPVPGPLHTASSNGSALPADGNVKKRDKRGPRAARDPDYPVLVDLASIDEQAARERARALAYRAGGIRLAPWNIPWRRRLQTLAVIMHLLTIVVLPAFFFFLCAIPLTWPIVIPYLLHMLLSKSATDGRLRMRSERWRRLPVWKFFAGYFPAQLHKTHELPPTRKYIFGYHPHGIISHGAFAAFGTEALGFADMFPGITNTLLTLDANFRVPLYRDYLLAAGLGSVSKESITNTLTKGGRNGEGMGRAVTIVIGGARESLEARPGVMHLLLAERKGFVKMALRTGADLVPVLAFGENDLYDQVSPKRHSKLHRLQMGLLRTLKFTLPFLHGRGIFNYDVGLMPYRRPLNVVVGRPIMVAQAKGGEIDGAELDRLHREYMEELRKMWELYKDVFAPARKEDDILFLSK